jgi:hypothetical protein
MAYHHASAEQYLILARLIRLDVGVAAEGRRRRRGARAEEENSEKRAEIP